MYSGLQYSVQKDIERMFGVIQLPFQILQYELVSWDPQDINDLCGHLYNSAQSGCPNALNGAFSEEANVNNIITEFYDTDIAKLFSSSCLTSAEPNPCAQRS